jgi:DNA helicase MCM8
MVCWLNICIQKDVVEIMKESLFDKYIDEHGLVDFSRSSGMSHQKETKLFLSTLNKESELTQKDCFSISVNTNFVLLS